MPLQVPETRFDSIKNQILSFAASSSRSGKPAIYGIAATAELQRIKPLSEDSNLEVCGGEVEGCVCTSVYA